MQTNYPTIYVVGPTASGKSKLAVMLAKRLGGVVISADSMQIYKGLDIGTAKIKEEEKEGVEHKLIDIVDAESEFSVAEYKELATREIQLAKSRGKYPIVAGGTGLYFEALLYPYSFANANKNEDIRNYLVDFCKINGNEALWQTLSFLDEKSAERLHPNDVKRVVRALEIVLSNDRPVGEVMDELSQDMSDVIMVGLTDDREKLYKRINDRVDKMFDEGLLSEALNVGNFDCQSMQAIGYKEFKELQFDLVDGKISPNAASLAAVKDKIKQHTRNYAKRQLTWFRRYKFATWFAPNELEAAVEYVVDRLNKQNSN